MTAIEEKRIELKENEKLARMYDEAIKKQERGEEVNYLNLLLAEKMMIDTIIESMKQVKYGEEWIQYTNGQILKSIAENIVNTPCPKYTQDYGVRNKGDNNASK